MESKILTKLEIYVRNKSYTEEILCDKGKKSNFLKVCKTSLL